MADRETQYVTLVNDNPPSPSSSSLLSPRRKVERGWLKVRQSAHRFWMLEVLASALSLLIFMTILVALYYLDNSIYSNASGTQGNETRRPHIFPILAFSSAVMRATMLLPVATAIGQLKWSWFRSPRRLIDIERFDEAARGILGSAKLFFYLRFRNLAAMGAALTILALPIDALIQSAIRMPTKVELVNNLRNLSPEFMEAQNETFLERAVSYTKWQTMTDATDVWPETAMVNAIQYGLGFINGPSDYVKTQTIVDCPTGYCDFTKAQTLSVGYECMYRDDIVYVPRKGNMAPYQTLPGTDLRLYVEGYRGVTRQRIVAATYSQYPVPEPILDYPMEYFDNDPLLKIKVPLIARTSMMFNWINATGQKALRSTYAMDCALFWKVRTMEMNEYAWRRSALPLLFHGLEDHERFAQGDVRDFKVMQDAAKEIRVRLTEHVDENGARLTTQK
ncbi:hypothetical protein E8E12_008772 [Didymella heteroderae]|uniref:Uncharacterized protein n=1 Tax=Didymella heteroderae TaxID=1769908 RepID=A0A9P5C0P7_9PLEO|nr:hypothetical protein E8E12_008772 [Didymella heteroderae]